MNRIASRTGICLVICLLLVAGFGLFLLEFFTQSGSWVMHPGSPHVFQGDNIGCGTVVDRDGNLLLDLGDGRTYVPDEILRMATVHWLGDRNSSISIPVLSHYADAMAGYDGFNGLYAYGGVGGQAKITLSSYVQKAALEALAGQKGTVAVYNYQTGELICAVTTPTFDPDNVPELTPETEEKYEGMYLNRFIQSLYTPGSIFKIVTLAAALEEFPEIRQMHFTCEGKLSYGVDEIVCTGKHGTQDLKTAFRNSCNCAFAQIAGMLGGEKLQAYGEKFGITTAVTFDGITTAQGQFAPAGAADVNVAWSAIGQYTDLINPCSFLTFVGAIAAGGRGTTPYLVEEIRVGNKETYSAATQFGDLLVSKETAETIREFMRFNVQDAYGDENFPGLNVCAKTGTAEVGGEKKPNAMLTGFVADSSLPLAFIVCVEDGGYGSAVCIPIASEILSACKEAFGG